MAKMQVRFSFDDELIEKKGVKRRDIYYTIKKNFTQKGLKCVSDGEQLVFEDMGHEDDYGNMWAIILALVDCDWFTDCASSCVFVENGKREDVLSQVPEIKRIMATAYRQSMEEKTAQEIVEYPSRKQITFDLSDKMLKRKPA